MKKRVIKSISIALAVIMLFSCGISQALAATAETVEKYGEAGGYLAIGDSICRGCGAEGFYTNPDTLEKDDANKDGEGQYGEYSVRNVFGCVPYQIAQAVGCVAPYRMDEDTENATYWPFAFPGMTTAVTLDLLGIDDGFTDEKLNYAYYKDMLEYFGWSGSFDGVRDGDNVADVTSSRGGIGKCGDIMELIPRADLITVQLGMCDVFYRTYRIVSNGGMLADGMSFDLSSSDAIKELVETAIGEMWNGFNYWAANYPKLIEFLQEKNPDAEIVMVGSFNLVNELTITDDLLAPIGSVFSVITDSMNRLYEQWAKKYGVKYADISSTETQAAELDWSLLGDFKDNTFTGTHPTQNGYDYIARQILSVLPPEDGSTGTTISIDIGKYDKVDYVLVNGHKVSNYSVDGHRLTVRLAGDNANSLTIGVVNDDGSIAVQSYTLKYTEGKGYTAQRVYGTNNFKDTILKPFMLIVKLFKMILEKLGLSK